MDDGRSPGVEEEQASQDLATPTANHLWLGTKTTHVTGEGGREGGRMKGERGKEKEWGR